MSSNNQSTNKGFLDAITTPVTIIREDNVTGISVMVSSGTALIQGTGKFRGAVGAGVTVSAGQPFTETASPGSVLEGYTITPSGTVQLALKFW